MPHHRNADTGHRSHTIDYNCAAFQLDCLSPSLQKPSRIAKRVFVAGLIGHERHIADDERSLGSPSHKLRVVAETRGLSSTHFRFGDNVSQPVRGLNGHNMDPVAMRPHRLDRPHRHVHPHILRALGAGSPEFVDHLLRD